MRHPQVPVSANVFGVYGRASFPGTADFQTPRVTFMQLLRSSWPCSLAVLIQRHAMTDSLSAICCAGNSTKVVANSAMPGFWATCAYRLLVPMPNHCAFCCPCSKTTAKQVKRDRIWNCPLNWSTNDHVSTEMMKEAALTESQHTSHAGDTHLSQRCQSM